VRQRTGDDRRGEERRGEEKRDSREEKGEYLLSSTSFGGLFCALFLTRSLIRLPISSPIPLPLSVLGPVRRDLRGGRPAIPLPLPEHRPVSIRITHLGAVRMGSVQGPRGGVTGGCAGEARVVRTELQTVRVDGHCHMHQNSENSSGKNSPLSTPHYPVPPATISPFPVLYLYLYLCLTS
jgi:hypothetical protein